MAWLMPLSLGAIFAPLLVDANPLLMGWVKDVARQEQRLVASAWTDSGD